MTCRHRLLIRVRPCRNSPDLATRFAPPCSRRMAKLSRRVMLAKIEDACSHHGPVEDIRGVVRGEWAHFGGGHTYGHTCGKVGLCPRAEKCGLVPGGRTHNGDMGQVHVWETMVGGLSGGRTGHGFRVPGE